MIKIQQVRCPNCGKFAHRQFLHQPSLMQTACPACDYLMINCRITGKVVEYYAPGIAA